MQKGNLLVRAVSAASCTAVRSLISFKCVQGEKIHISQALHFTTSFRKLNFDKGPQ